MRTITAEQVLPAEVALERLDISIDVTRFLSTCSIAVRQMVAIVRVLDLSSRSPSSGTSPWASRPRARTAW